MSDTLCALQEANPDLDILPISAPEFARYGTVLARYDPAEMIARAKAILPRASDVVYETSVTTLEAPSAFSAAMEREVYGEMPVQVGWCYGLNLQMKGLEYHKGNEVDVCLTDVVLLVGHVQDIAWGARPTFDTRKVAAFYAPAGAVVELPAWNLHFAPIHVREDEPFATLVYLPRGTNEPLRNPAGVTGESRMLFAVNKWLLVHPEAGDLVAEGAYPGLVGDDVFVQPTR